MKLDKIKFGRLVAHCISNGMSAGEYEVDTLDQLCDIDVPEAAKVNHEDVNELLRCMLSANADGFIPAIKAYRALTNAGLKEAKEAIERYRSTVAITGWTKKELQAKINLHVHNDTEHKIISKFVSEL